MYLDKMDTKYKVIIADIGYDQFLKYKEKVGEISRTKPLMYCLGLLARCITSTAQSS